MKSTKIIKGMLAMLFTGVLFSNAFAEVEPVIAIEPDKPTTQLTLDVPESGNDFVTIFAPDGKSIFSERIKSNSKIVKVFDFAGLDDGIYTMVTNSENKSVEKTIEFKNQDVSIVGKKTNYMPIITEDGDKLRINYLNEDQGNISLTLKDSFWIYHDEKAGNAMAYGKTLDTSELPKGNYTLTLKVDDKEYTYNFRK
jgi:hypothetical protein